MNYGDRFCDSKLALISRMTGVRPEHAKYVMVLPENTNFMRNNMGCSAALRHLHEVLDRKSLVFSIFNMETEGLASTVMCRMDAEDYSYTYTIKSFEEQSEELNSFQKECVEFAVKNLMRGKRIHSADYNMAHQAYNVLGCAAIQA